MAGLQGQPPISPLGPSPCLCWGLLSPCWQHQCPGTAWLTAQYGHADVDVSFSSRSQPGPEALQRQGEVSSRQAAWLGLIQGSAVALQWMLLSIGALGRWPHPALEGPGLGRGLALLCRLLAAPQPHGLGCSWPGCWGARSCLVSCDEPGDGGGKVGSVKGTTGLAVQQSGLIHQLQVVRWGWGGTGGGTWRPALTTGPFFPQDPCLSALLDKLPAPGALSSYRLEAERRCDVCATHLHQLTREALRLLQAPAGREDLDSPHGGPGPAPSSPGSMTSPRDVPVVMGPAGRQPSRVGPDRRKGLAWPSGPSVQVSVAPAGLGGALSTVTIQAQQCLEGMWSVSRVNSFLPPSCLVSAPGRVDCGLPERQAGCRRLCSSWVPSWGSVFTSHQQSWGCGRWKSHPESPQARVKSARKVTGGQRTSRVSGSVTTRQCQHVWSGWCGHSSSRGHTWPPCGLTEGSRGLLG